MSARWHHEDQNPLSVYKAPTDQPLLFRRTTSIKMVLPTTEIIIFDASEEFQSDPSIATAAFNIVLKAAGVQAPAYYGLQIENPKTGYIFLNWDSLEHHQAIINDPSYPELLAALKPSIGGELKMNHVQFSAPTVAFEKPVTEVLVLTLKAPENRATVEEILTKISEVSEKMLVFGKTVEEENKYILVGGWPTVEAHWETVAKPDVAAALTKLYSLASKDHLFHSKLSSYQLPSA
ncbi:hypothetical protein HYDPIDRAFT_115547 [Hydnomerulius pinastri MD-312]|uniref:ABM domain-containing protein n=1 Tax=Hydnomerulius pinastri MD-312 TaxID=994086 RepID=A0A0C9W561_9AGAM|nr:hypothetical protein HYDPIDRAFT_115547 [Hydnomerulius pinastri MD-312]